MVAVGLPAVWFIFSVSAKAEFPVVIEGNPTGLGLVVSVQTAQTTLNKWTSSTQQTFHSPTLTIWYKFHENRVCRRL